MNTTASSNSERGGGRALGRGAVMLPLLLVLAALTPAAADVSVSPSVAGLFVGEDKVVEGTVTAAERDTNIVRLHLGKAPQELAVSLVIGWLNTFPPTPERYYLGKTVRVAGTIRSFRGTPEMIIRDAADIQLVGDTSVAAAPGRSAEIAPTEQTGREAALQRRVDSLTDQVHRLEQRIQQLEGGSAQP